MNQKQRAKWEQTRSRGMWRFVLLYGILIFGGAMIIVTSGYSMMIGTFASNNLRLTVPVFLVSGFVFGMALWLVGEYMYRKSSQQSGL
jgi:uncharacterized membrane-anchored protein